MALNFSALKVPVSTTIVDPATGVMRQEWIDFFRDLVPQLNASTGVLSTDKAPADAEFVVAAANSTLSAERVATDTTTVDVDMATAAQAKWNVKEVPGIAGNGMVARTAAATYAARTLTAGTGISISNGDGVAGNPTITAVQLMTLGRRAIADISSGGTITTADRATNVVIQSGTGTLSFDDVATFAADFYCIIQNAGDGVVTLDPNTTQQIDGVTSWALYPGGVIIAQIASSAWHTTLIKPMRALFTASGTLVRPRSPNIKRGYGRLWGGGAGGGRGQSGGGGAGGGGGSGIPFDIPIASFGSTETVTIGPGGAGATADNTVGTAGTASSLGTLVTAPPGGAGGYVTGAASGGGGGGGGGGASTAGTSNAGNSNNGGAGGGQNGGTGATSAATDNNAHGQGGGGGGFGADGATTSPGGGATDGGGGGGGGSSGSAAGGAGGSSVFGGGGGGGSSATGTVGAAGTSAEGGAGGIGASGNNTGGNGTAPAGGGGGSAAANAGSGARGELRIIFE